MIICLFVFNNCYTLNSVLFIVFNCGIKVIRVTHDDRSYRHVSIAGDESRAA